MSAPALFPQPSCRYYGKSHTALKIFGELVGPVDSRCNECAAVQDRFAPCKMEALGHQPDEKRCPIARGFDRFQSELARCDREIARIEAEVRGPVDPRDRAYLSVMGSNDWAHEKRLIQKALQKLVADGYLEVEQDGEQERFRPSHSAHSRITATGGQA